jgi:hypothetical protein
MSECPVCYTEMKEQIETIDWGGPICEHYENCPNDCYLYEFSYGYTTVFVNIRDHHLQFGWGYNDDRGTLYAEQDAINVVIAAAQRAQLEDYWKIVNENKAGRPQESR